MTCFRESLVSCDSISANAAFISLRLSDFSAVVSAFLLASGMDSLTISTAVLSCDVNDFFTLGSLDREIISSCLTMLVLAVMSASSKRAASAA